ncbi:MAG: DUF167 domain-containing protein [Proteobacteria bacterium]|nr:DUF167 domain-containing protein [Pseudomonadota bacterium]
MKDYKWQDKDGQTFILIKVKPGSKRTVINGIVDVKTVYPVKKALSISISSQPEDNKANKELIEFMADNLNLPKSSIRISHGLKNRLKVISIAS